VTDLDRQPVRRPGRFEPERLLMLVDGVFAISMTLLALDVRVPEDVPDTAAGFAENAPQLLGRLLVFVVAFAITSRFWIVNHRQMATLHHVDTGVIQRTVLFLAGITSLPVATSVLFRYGGVPEAVTFASLVLAATAALSMRLWRYVSDPARDLADVSADDRRTVTIRMALVVVVYLLAIPLAFALPEDLVGITPFIWMTMIAVDPIATRLGRLRGRAPVEADQPR
jgi:uncharacterized membrane protein